ncbi:MAG: FkbM family methyltransferase, partial [Roseimicrobium sp.]
PFDGSHANIITVSLCTLAGYCREHGLKQVDFLKVDAEGHDLDVLRGFPWDLIQPRFVICEFEDLKQEKCESGFRAMAEFLRAHGYSVLVSEWDPVLSYHGPFNWRRFFVYPGDLPDPAGNGNILAVRTKRDFSRLRLRAAMKSATYRLSMTLRAGYQYLRKLISR